VVKIVYLGDWVILDFRLTIDDLGSVEAFGISVSRKVRKGKFAKEAELQKIIYFNEEAELLRTSHFRF